MQNLIKYSSVFTPMGIYNHSYIGEFISQIREYNQIVAANPIPDTSYNHIIWSLPYHKPLKDEYYDILYIIAKFTRVKLMWRLAATNEGTDKFLWVIGEGIRIRIFDAIASAFFTGQFSFELWYKTHDKGISRADSETYKSAKDHLRDLLIKHEDMVFVFMSKLLEFEPADDLKLQGYIKERYKLDYKNYNTDHHEYYHAISKRFHHKRMLL